MKKAPEGLSPALALLAETDFPWPDEGRVVMGGRLARLIGWVMARFDAPPLAVTVGRAVFITDLPCFASLSVPEQAALLAHEAVHIAQWQRLGFWRMAAHYAREFLKVRRQGVNTHDPERGIDMEREAIAVERLARAQAQAAWRQRQPGDKRRA